MKQLVKEYPLPFRMGIVIVLLVVCFQTDIVFFQPGAKQRTTALKSELEMIPHPESAHPKNLEFVYKGGLGRVEQYFFYQGDKVALFDFYERRLGERGWILNRKNANEALFCRGDSISKLILHTGDNAYSVMMGWGGAYKCR